MPQLPHLVRLPLTGAVAVALVVAGVQLHGPPGPSAPVAVENNATASPPPTGNGELIIRQAEGWALVHP